MNEGSGLMDNLVFVIKQDGRASEQTLVVLVEIASSSVPATRGENHACMHVH